MKLSKRLSVFPEYVFSELGRKKREVEKNTGRKVLDLSIGTPDYPPSRRYTAKLKEFIDHPDTHLYPGYGASPDFIKATQAFYKSRFGVVISDNELFPLLGGKDGVAHLPLALADAGDEFLVPDPGYPGFVGPALMIGLKPIYYLLSEKNNFKPDLDELEEKVTKKTKYIWVNFPSNPTGQVATIEELKPIVKFAKKHDLVLIFDNAYSEITYDGFVAPSILQIPEARDVAVELGSFSKSHSFAGLRMGWLVGNAQVIAALAKIKSQMDSGMFLPLQKVGAYALTNRDRSWEKKMISDYLSRRNIVAKQLKKAGFEFELPRGGLYIWAKIPAEYTDSLKLTLDWLKNKQVLFAPGTAFGENGKNYVRVCFSSNIDGIQKYF